MSTHGYQVSVTYPLTSFPVLDETIAAIANQYGGFDIAGGAGFGERNLIYHFPTYNACLVAFIFAALSLPGVSVEVMVFTAAAPAKTNN